MESAKKFVSDQVGYYDKYLMELDLEKRDLKSKLDLVQQKYEIYKEKQEDYKAILVEMDSADGMASRSVTFIMEDVKFG